LSYGRKRKDYNKLRWRQEDAAERTTLNLSDSHGGENDHPRRNQPLEKADWFSGDD
jgi:hypothetical protein